MSRNSSPSSGSAISVENLRKTYGEGADAVTAVDGVSFDVEPGTIVGLLGPNGAGKTTTIKSMLGLILPDSGSVDICGIDAFGQPERAHARVGAMLEGDRNVYWRLTVRENLEFFAGLGGEHPGEVRERHDRLLERLGLADRDETVVNELSTGMKQKVSLASTLARDVDVVFLDEPTLGLDVETSLELHTELRRLAEDAGVTIVLTSHDMDVIEAVSDRVLILQDGSIIADDDVENLVDILATQSLRVTVPAPIHNPVRTRLESGLGLSVEADGETVTIECQAADSQTVYDLMRLLEGQDTELREIESVDPDLEEIFLQLTSDDASDDDEAAAAGEQPNAGADGEGSSAGTSAISGSSREGR